MRYSKTTGCFYPKNKKYTNLPSDLITITRDNFNQVKEKRDIDTLDVINDIVVIIHADPLSAEKLFENAQLSKINDLSNACKSSIYAGFTSDALGASHQYPAKDIDQQNLTASVLASLLPDVVSPEWNTPFWCADNNGVWDYRLHTAAQIQQVGRDAKAAVLASTIKNATLAAAVLALPETASQADFDAIAW